jgi:hypothetical protein
MHSVDQPSDPHAQAAKLRADGELAMHRLLEAVVQIQKQQQVLAAREAYSQVTWLEGGGWTAGADGLWRHAQQAADAGLTRSQAFASEARTRTLAHALDPGLATHAARTAGGGPLRSRKRG